MFNIHSVAQPAKVQKASHSPRFASVYPVVFLNKTSMPDDEAFTPRETDEAVVAAASALQNNRKRPLPGLPYYINDRVADVFDKTFNPSKALRAMSPVHPKNRYFLLTNDWQGRDADIASNMQAHRTNPIDMYAEIKIKADYSRPLKITMLEMKDTLRSGTEYTYEYELPPSHKDTFKVKSPPRSWEA